jgi:6,7-dimethyl-8-ribityllumazine synthase
MAGFLPKNIEAFHKIPYARVAIIAAMWHPECVNAMVDRTVKELLVVGVESANIEVHFLPGSLELPYAARCLFERDASLDAIVAFGIVLKGDTTHDDNVLHNVVEGFSKVTDRFHKPIINEVIGVKTIADAQRRSDHTLANKGVEAVFALTELLHWKNSLQ